MGAIISTDCYSFVTRFVACWRQGDACETGGASGRLEAVLTA